MQPTFSRLTFPVHQPRSEIWSLFDNLILLTKGSPAYAGSATQCLNYFAKLGHEMPAFTNPAEHLIDIVSIDNRSEEAETVAQARVGRIVTAWREELSRSTSEKGQSESMAIGIRADSIIKTKERSSFLRQVHALTERTFKVTTRDPMGMFGCLVEALAMSIITGWIFLQIDGSLSGIRSRQGALYTAVALQGYLILLYETYRLTIDVQLFDEESRQGVVGIPAFLISRRLARLLIEDIPVSPLFGSILEDFANFHSFFCEGAFNLLACPLFYGWLQKGRRSILDLL
jgi:hypothetical protein